MDYPTCMFQIYLSLLTVTLMACMNSTLVSAQNTVTNYTHFKAFGSVGLTGDGVAPIPSFTLNDPSLRIILSNLLTLEIEPEIFYFNFTEKEDSLFFAKKISISDNRLPIYSNFQAIRHL